MQHNLEILKRLSQELGLIYESQDWGIVNACADRTEEFIYYFEHAKCLERTLQYAMFELIVASMNEAIVDGVVSLDLSREFQQFIVACSSDDLFEPIRVYWRSLEGSEYPVSRLI